MSKIISNCRIAVIPNMKDTWVLIQKAIARLIEKLYIL